ncbi:phage tail domain-containing protein [Isobaculum melis]|uniref:Phage tail protein n=1 Tax=Isobaculum melis TaxID=142588 RepID=A0A1H9TH97_9LACT|nr:phage tail domain-containing protein [Isobaculum melis]SER96407.1 Phage tail protein [Isobaculum melis]
MECEIFNKVANKKLTIKDYVEETYQTDGHPTGNYFFIKLDGLGEVQADRKTMDANGDGTLYMASTLAEREIQIEFIIQADETKSMEELRREVSHIFNPKAGLLELRYTEEQKSYRIQVASDHVPSFTTDGYLSKKGQRVSITLVASDPFWYATTAETHYLSNWLPNFEWDLTFPVINELEEGIELEVLQENGLVQLTNDGDEKTGMTMLLTATGDVETPKIIRVMPDGTETQFMQLNRGMKSGDIVRIRTISGNKRIEQWDDQSKKWLNIFNVLSLDSTFIQLDVGENFLRYEALKHPEQLEINVQYDLRYVGV